MVVSNQLMNKTINCVYECQATDYYVYYTAYTLYNLRYWFPKDSIDIINLK